MTEAPRILIVEARFYDDLADALQRANTALGEHVQAHPLEVGAVLQFYFECLGVQRLLDLHVQRDPLYREVADFVVEGNGLSATQVAQRVAMQVELTPP